jgi:fatty-acyl-CoA synthase
MAESPGVSEATVFGVVVGEAEGKAGMASLVVGPDFDLAKLSEHIDHELPSYARPLFLRIQKDISTTGTFKYLKTDLEADGFDTRKTRDPIWFRDPQAGWVRLNAKVRDRIMSGEIKL